MPAKTREAIANALGSGAAPAGQHTSPGVVLIVKDAFVSAVGTGLTIGVVIVLLGAALSFLLVQRTPAAAPAPQRGDAAEPAGEAVGIDLAA